jgi:hypothetical protein
MKYSSVSRKPSIPPNLAMLNFKMPLFGILPKLQGIPNIFLMTGPIYKIKILKSVGVISHLYGHLH